MKPLPGTENIKFDVVKNKLLIQIDLRHRGQVTAKGNARVCSSLGNKEIPGTKGIMFGLNAYVKP